MRIRPLSPSPSSPRSRRLARTAAVLVALLGTFGASAVAGAVETAPAPAGAPAALPAPDGERISSYRVTDAEIAALERRGRRVTYRTSVTNREPRTVRNVEVCEPLPRGLRFVTATRGFEMRDDRVCWVMTLRAGRRADLRIVVRTLTRAGGSERRIP
ncbi:MAG: hypothetical protein WC558_08570 [Patulibacter sp.]